MKNNILDAIERIIFIVFALTFYSAFLGAAKLHPHYVLLLIGETLGLIFVLFRPWNQPMATDPRSIIVAILGSVFPLLVRPIGLQPELVTLGGIIIALGIMLSLSGKVALNRRFGMIAANRGVQRSGPYALVRHPIYAGYTVAHIGYLITNPAWWNFAVYAGALLCQILRINAEERYMGADPDYQAYSTTVKYRLIPGIY